ncbi:MAG: AAA family ATPase [Actinomycetota bacterium]|nr:AAA family ATPase [Actinomycetota bacterium]
MTRRAADGSHPPLLERERELELLSSAVDRASKGTGSLLLIEGPAGIGKTRLVGEAARLARDRDWLVRTATAGEIERDVPYGVARQLLEGVLQRSSEAERSRLLSGSARLALIAVGDEETDRSATTDPLAPIHGLYWLLSNVSESQPVLLAIDDVQWSDSQSLRFIDYLSRRLADLPALVVTTVRTGEPHAPPELAPLRTNAESIELRSLTPPAVRDLIVAETGTEPTVAFSEACAVTTNGNPFLVAEILRGLRADGLAPGDDAAEAIARLAPDTITQHVLVRLARFGDEAVALARAIAILGGSPQLRHAAQLADLTQERARILCDDLCEAEILAPGLPIDFVHPLVRQAIYAEHPEGERSALHLRAAELLTSMGAEAREIAPHLLACTPNGDQWVVTRLRDAARAARAEGAHDNARVCLERALVEPPDDDVEDRYWIGRALFETDPARAPGFFGEVAGRASDSGLRLAALRWAALAHFVTGNVTLGLERSIEALDAVSEDDREQRLVLEAQVFGFTTAGLGRTGSSSKRIRDIAVGINGSTPAESATLQALSAELFHACDPVEQVVEAAAHFPPPTWEVEGVRTLGPIFGTKVLAASGRWAQARAALGLFTEECHASGRLHGQSWAHAWLAEVERFAGSFPDAEVEAETALEIARVLASFSPSAWNASLNLLGTLIARGHLERAEALAEQLPMSLGPGDVPITPWPIEMRGHLRLAQGNVAGAAEDLLSLGETCERLGLLNPAFPTWRQEVAPALAALGRTAEAEEVIAIAEDRAQRFGAPHVIGAVLRARALLQSRRSQIDTLRRSVSALEVYGPPHELARSLTELGAAIRRKGSRVEAREPLAKGMELADRCGADGLAQQARDELLAAGARPRRAARTGPTALTASELRIARLAAEGLTNRQIAERLFVTLRTVETHLTHVYDKLQITGRGELKAVLSE